MGGGGGNAGGPSADSGGLATGTFEVETASLSLKCEIVDCIEGTRLREGSTGNSRLGEDRSGEGSGRTELCTQKEKCASVLRRFVFWS